MPLQTINNGETGETVRGKINDNFEFVQTVEGGGTGANSAQGARVNLETAKPVWGEVVLTTGGWGLSGGVYVQTVACAWAKAEMEGNPYFFPKYSTDETSNEALDEAAALIRYIDTADGSIVARTKGSDKPQVNLTLLFTGAVE